MGVEGIVSALLLASHILFSSLKYPVVSTVKCSFSLLLLCHINVIEGSAGKTNNLEKTVWPEEEVSPAWAQPPSWIYRDFFGI